MRTKLHIVALGLLSACTYDEGLIIENMKGTVRIPAEAGTAQVTAADGSVETIVDAKLLGPVFLGLYPSLQPAGTIAPYPHPEVGPQFVQGQQALSYPYGGTSVGDFRFSCIQALECKLVTGRYTDFDDIVNWFTKELGFGLSDASGQPVVSGAYLQQVCFDILQVSTDRETRLVAQDRNEDGAIDTTDLELQLEGDFFVGEFEILQQEFFWDQRQEGCEPGIDCAGFTLWGFVDNPDSDYNFETCVQGGLSGGFNIQDYATDYIGGAFQRDILNLPSSYITGGDWVASEGFRWDNIYDQPELVIDWEVQ